VTVLGGSTITNANMNKCGTGIKPYTALTRRKEGKKERRKEGKKERRKEGKKE